MRNAWCSSPATGSGKSTSLAAMIDHINASRTAHIITIEIDRYLHRDLECIINQREIGVDTRSFARAARPPPGSDVILVGEMRDMETIETAMHAAKPAASCSRRTRWMRPKRSTASSRYSPHQQKQIRLQLASVQRGGDRARLIPRRTAPAASPR